MAQPEVEAAWRAEFERIHETETFDSPDDPMAAFPWSGDEAEARRLQEEHTHHYLRWALTERKAISERYQGRPWRPLRRGTRGLRGRRLNQYHPVSPRISPALRP
jgi:hypothetical protein